MPINFGIAGIEDIKFGNNQIAKVYQGNDQIWPPVPELIWTYRPDFRQAITDGTGFVQTATGVVWDGSKYVVVAGNAQCATSTDGINWTKRPSLFSAMGYVNFKDLAWNSNIFCAVGGGGSGQTFGMADCATSPDGITWTKRPSLAAVLNERLESVAWSGNLFCAVGDKGVCATSPDGITWTSRPSLASQVGTVQLNTIIWNGNQFCTVGMAGACATSPDGITWTNQPDLSNKVNYTYGNDFYGLAWDGSQFCTVGKVGLCGTSPDGITWTRRTSGLQQVTTSWVYSLVWDGLQFVGVGANGKCATSTNGIKWKEQPTLSSVVGGSGVYMKLIGFNGNQVVAFGEAGKCATSP